jgi:glycosyltransferase involved in cell wall biosynthesis
MPPLELSMAAVRYGGAHGVPVVVDIRDMWPDIWLDLAPKPLRPVARLALTPFYRMLRTSVDLSSAVTGIAGRAVEWALAHGTRKPNAFDSPLPLAYQPGEISPAAFEAADREWRQMGIVDDPQRLTVCFFGSLSRRLAFDTVFSAMACLPSSLAGRLRLVMCGAGERADELKARARTCPSILMPGWIDAAQITALMRLSHIGLLPYPNTDDFLSSIPNKVYDYLSGGLPILTSLRGTTGELIEREKCGWIYSNDEPESLVAQLTALTNDREEIRRAALASVRVAKLFSAAKVYGDFRVKLDDITRAYSVAGTPSNHPTPVKLVP